MTTLKHSFDDFFPLRPARVHEVCGVGAWGFALGNCHRYERKIFWLYEEAADVPCYESLYNYQVATKFQFVRAHDPLAQLWCFEEALRSGMPSLVISVHHKPIAFTPMRRLQLAAETGKVTGLVITALAHGSPVSETRWHCTPIYDPNGRAVQRWELAKNKQGPLGQWEVLWNDKTHRFTVV
jgi:protein ImuA